MIKKLVVPTIKIANASLMTKLFIFKTRAKFFLIIHCPFLSFRTKRKIINKFSLKFLGIKNSNIMEIKTLCRWVFIEEFVPIFRDGIEAEKIHIVKIAWLEENEYKKYSWKYFLRKLIDVWSGLLSKQLTARLLLFTGICEMLPAGFKIIRQKGLDKINDAALYVLPDMAIADNEFWKEYHRPGGDEKKSLLGGWMTVCGEKVGRRVKAKKFNNFFEKDSFDEIYSNGILINEKELPKKIRKLKQEDIPEELGILKFTTEDSVGGSMSGLTHGDLPSFLSETDEELYENANKMKVLMLAIEQGERFRLTQKRDGKSGTFFVKNIDGKQTEGVCSRNLWKTLEQRYTQQYIDLENNTYRPHYDKLTKSHVWFCEATESMLTTEQIIEKGFTPIEVEVRDSWVDMYLLHENKYREKFLEYANKYNLEIAIKGEILGLGGSGKSKNPDANIKAFMPLFDIYDISGAKQKRLNLSNEHNLDRFCSETGLPQVNTVWEGKVSTLEELLSICKRITNEFKINQNIYIEGIVIRTTHSNLVSCKWMNPEYDAKK